MRHQTNEERALTRDISRRASRTMQPCDVIADPAVCELLPLFELQTDDPIFDSPTPLSIFLGDAKEVYWRMRGAALKQKKRAMVDTEPDEVM